MDSKVEQLLKAKNAELEKQLAQKIRDLGIEAALERLRARAMAMQSSNELADLAAALFNELSKLDITLTRCMIWLMENDASSATVWMADPVADKAFSSRMKFFDLAYHKAFIKAWRERKQQWVYELKGKEKQVLNDLVFSMPGTANTPEEVKAAMIATESVTLSFSFSNFGGLQVDGIEPLSEENLDILSRFSKVFDQTYTRFNDLQKAEAQARESQIQLALERVRARTMAMQKSEELAETATVLFQQLLNLGISSERTFIGIPNDDTRKFELWGTEQGGHQMSTRFEYEADATYAFSEIYKAWQEKRSELTVILKGKNLKEHVNYVRNVLHMPLLVGLVQKQRILYNAFFSKGLLMIVTPDVQSKETFEILKRFAGVFDGTYTRFLDLQRAESQAREATIEAALERVRSRTMGMQKSEELAEVIQLVYDQLCQLNFNIDNANFVVNYRESDDLDLWLAVNGQRYSTKMHIPYLDHPIFNRLNKAKKKGLSFFSDSLTFEEKNTFFRHLFENAPQVPQERKKAVFESPGYARSVVFMKTIALSIQNYAAIPYSDAENVVLTRFGKVFEQTYTRFNDLKIAEEQVREATIEAALERVRSKTMAMHNSADVADATAVMFDELIKLGVEKMVRCGIGILSQSSSQMELWTAKAGESEKPELVIGHFDVNIHPMLKGIYNAWHKREPSFSYLLKGDDMVKYFEIINNQPDYPIKYDISKLPSKQYQNDFFFTEGALFAFTSQPLSDEISSVFKRFAGVFGQTYRRYFDLQKAEAQALEAQIELSLERVRAKTMAMHTSEHVGDTVATMFDELVKLGIEKTARCGIAIIGDNREMELWRASYNPDGKVDKVVGRIDMTIHPLLEGIYQAWKNKDTDYTYELTGKTQKDYFRALNNSPQYPTRFDLTSLPAKQINSGFFFPEGCVYAFTIEPLSADAVKLFKRFAGVFGLTYRRFLDLQKAEDAAREAQIEAALERVRSKAMAMRSSNDLNATANTVFIELRKLGVDLVRCGLGLQEKDSHITTIHAATNSDEGGNLEVLGQINMNIHPVFEGSYNHWRQNKDYFPVLEAESLRTYYEALHESGISVPEWKSGEKQYGYFLQFAYGSLYAWSGKQENEITIKTFKRFTSVIGLTYTRYIELQKAESNTKEAIKQASLDRVRAEIASMRKRSDLERITPLIWDELTILGIPFIRCGVFIMDEEQKLIHTFLSTPDGKAIGAFHIPFDTSGNFEIMVDNWRHKEPYIDHWKEEAFSQFADALVKQGAIASKAQYMRTLPHEGVHLNFLPFLQGMLYVGNVEPLTEDNIDLIRAVADAFSTAYARYEDFNKLEAAKQQVDNTLSDLKAAQTKLIQSEKMASLGELTAGIAHEIQNPLNFVNNFSEVNQEMIDELEEELKAGNIEEALAIAADIKQNEEKISHHGKRADGIVKGMLQHSRTGGGEKQLTNMNVLADEFLRLSYHGLRAKDKTFNAEMVTHFDSDLPKISVIAQDMGRVMLNLFNNAFYAVNQKKKTAPPDYRPDVSVTTLTENGQLIIKVKDNGTGMPDHVKEKIMQPFFTTKPTGEGTGLGLSLTYDMVVKGHGGKIDVNTNEGEYTEFIISLPLN